MKILGLSVALMAALTSNVSADANSIPLPLRSLGPLTINMTKAQVEKILGGPGSACKLSGDDERTCYTDGTSLLIITYDGLVVGLAAQEKLDATTRSSAKIRLRIASWSWNGTPVFASRLPLPPPSWTANGTGHRYVSYASGGYGFSKSYSQRDGWSDSIGED
jgi:hypothetical protein